MSTDASSLSATDSRLSPDVIPVHYDLTIRTDLRDLTFSGTVEIDVRVEKPVEHLTLHAAAPLQLKAAVIVPTDGQKAASRTAEKIVVDEKKQRAQVSFANGRIEAGDYKLGLRWNGKIKPSLEGYYSSSYTKNGDEKAKAFYAVTQFEPCHARQAFPCFDEPALKATFTISLISRTGTVSLANTDVESTSHLGEGGHFPRTELLDEQFCATETAQETIADGPGTTSDEDAATNVAEQSADDFKDDWEIVHFRPTPKVSTYLIAFANGAFEHIESSFTSKLSSRTVPLRVYTTWEHIKQAQLLLETTVKVLPIFEEIFDIAYPLPKLDTLVVSDFNGAMENWGLILGSSDCYLYDSEKSGLSAKKLTVAVQSHEVAHQWFGNVVTMEWWDNLWLNESFATLMGEVIIPHRIEPSWRVHSAFIKQHLARALTLDSLRSSHPIEMPCPSEDTITQIFDALTYSKGGSVLKMLSNFVGEERFLKGVSIYLKKHLYGSARTEDLLAGISEASGQDVGKMADNWLSKTGFPLITVEETEKGIKVRQNRFLATADATPEEDNTLWHVPLQLLVVDPKTGKSKVHSELVLSERETTIEIEDVANTTYKLNAETCGVYRTLYSAARLAKLGTEAGKGNTSAFSLNDRMGLVQDAAVVASSGYAKTSASLELLSQMKGEEENLVWQEIATAVKSIAATWWEQPKEVRDGISKFRRELFQPVAKRLGFEYLDSDDPDTTELRTKALSVLAESDDEETLKEFQKRFALFVSKNDETAIPKDLRKKIYSHCVQLGGEAEYEKVLEVYRNPPTPAHEEAAIRALCSSEKSEFVDRTLAMVLTDQVKSSNVSFFYYFLRANPAAKRKVWAHFKANFSAISSRFKGSFILGALVRSSFNSFTSEEDAQAVEAFFKDKDTSSYDQALNQSLDAVRASAKWLDRDADDVKQWLRAHELL